HLNVVGPDDEYLAIRGLNYSAADSIDELTVEVWEQNNGGGNTDIMISFDRNNYWRFALEGDAGGPENLEWTTKTETGSNHVLDPPPDYTNPNWYYIVGTFEAGQSPDKRIYVDATQIASAFAHLGASLGTGATRYGFIGAESAATTFNGLVIPNSMNRGRMDEIRISHVTRSATWLWATWRTIDANAAFTCYSAAEMQQSVDLVVDKSVSSTNLLSGSNLTYTITIDNVGAFSAGGLSVTDTLPAEVQFDAAVPPPSSQMGNTLIWNLPALGPGGNTAITIDTTVISPVTGLINNVARAGSNNPEIDPMDNADKANDLLSHMPRNVVERVGENLAKVAVSRASAIRSVLDSLPRNDGSDDPSGA
ncbi:MAG: LamG-like jellyroll fold domain-containing protein, partial [Verrucomicrobiota bacterium]